MHNKIRKLSVTLLFKMLCLLCVINLGVLLKLVSGETYY